MKKQGTEAVFQQHSADAVEREDSRARPEQLPPETSLLRPKEEPLKKSASSAIGTPSSRAQSRHSLQSGNTSQSNHPHGTTNLDYKSLEESSKRNNLSTPGTPSSRAQNRRSMHCSSGSFRNYSDDTQHLDYEFNFLLKLFDILQTDSLTDIQHWLKMATSKERECVSEMIRSVLDMEFNNQQEPAGEYAKKKKKLQDNMNGIKTTEAGPAGAAQHTRPASQIIQARLSRKQENDKDAKQHVPVWSHTAPALGSSRRVIPPSRPRTQEQIRKPAIGFSGKVHVRYSTPSMSAAKPSPGRNSNESRASMDHARKAPVVRCSTQTHTR